MLSARVRLLTFVCVFASALQVQAQFEVRSSAIKRNSETGRWLVGPDPTSRWALLQLFPEHAEAFADFLKLNEEEAHALLRLAQDSRQEEQRLMAYPDFSWDDSQEYRATIVSTADEILNPHQWKMLSRAAYRIEVNKVGLQFSLLKGRLGQAVGVHDQQHDALSRGIAEIETRMHKRIGEIRKSAELEAFELLTPEQREKAIELLLGTHQLDGITDEKVKTLRTIKAHEDKEASGLRGKN